MWSSDLKLWWMEKWYRDIEIWESHVIIPSVTILFYI
jgi:hypothetical protein